MKKEDNNSIIDLEEKAQGIGVSDSKPTSLLNVLLANEIIVKGKLLNEEQKRLISRIIDKIFEMEWEVQDKRIEMVFDLSLLIDKLNQ